jgi:hypothetical protein
MEKGSQMVLDQIDRLLELINKIDEKFESLLYNYTTTAAQQLSQDVISWDVEWDVVIPIKHIVAAYNLFTSQYIQALLLEKIDEDYIMILEETQGQEEENRYVTQVGVPSFCRTNLIY